MPLFATPERRSHAGRRCSLVFKNDYFDFDLCPGPSTAPIMKLETPDDSKSHGLPYSFNNQAVTASPSANSSFYSQNYEHSPTAAPTRSINEPLSSWQLLTPISSRRPSTDAFDIDGLSPSRASMSSGSGDYAAPESYTNNMCTLPDRTLQLYTPVSKPIVDIGQQSYDISSLNSSIYSNFSDSFHSDASSAMTFPQSSPGTQFEFSSPYINPAQTFYQPVPLSTPFQTPTRRTVNPLTSSFYNDNQNEAIQYFMSPTPSRARTPSRSSAKRRRGDTSSFTSSVSHTECELASSFCSSTSSSSASSSGSSSTTDSHENAIQGVVAERPKFFCNWPTCKKNPNSDACTASWSDDQTYRIGVGFKRFEHLTRHIKTHTQKKDLPCVFCLEEGKTSKKWIRDRADNFRQHLKVHTDNADGKKKGKRTTYRPEAAELLKWLEQEKGMKKKGKGRKRKAEEEEEEEEQMDVDMGGIKDPKVAEIVRKYWIVEAQDDEE